MNLVFSRIFWVLILALGFNFSVLEALGATFLKNFNELPYSYQEVTGISYINPDINNFWSVNKTKLLKTGNITEFDSASLHAMYGLASFFCRERINTDSQISNDKRLIHKNIPLEKNFITWSDTEVNFLLSTYSQHFWLRELSADEQVFFKKLTKQLNSHAEFEETAKTLMAICSTFLTAPEFLLN
jgi:hypothetical protein